jgi:glycosyltransferase involved in cell wall biosynthesis
MEPLVSVIIPTRNSEKTLNRCLESVRKQTYRNIEIIVADQESDDKTIKIAEKYGAKVLNLKKPLFYTPPTESRNAGAKLGSGEILYHLDSDMYLSRYLIKESIDKLSGDMNIGALIVHERDIAEGFWSRVKAFERRCYWGDDNIESARIVRKEIFDKVGGYDENISSGEDFDIHKRYKQISRIDFCANPTFHDLGKIDFIKLIKKKYHYGKTAGLYFKKNSTSGSILLKKQIGCYIKNYKYFFKHPIIGICSVFLKFCEFGSGYFGMTFSQTHDLNYKKLNK